MIEKSGALSVVLSELRGAVRLSQRALARASGVSEGTIRDIEGDATVSKPVTLRKLAVALAHDPLAIEPAEVRVEKVYQRLLVAAGHAAATQPVEALTAPASDREQMSRDELVAKVRAYFGESDRLLEFMGKVRRNPDLLSTDALQAIVESMETRTESRANIRRRD